MLDRNYTYNASDTFALALGLASIKELHGLPCSECVLYLERALNFMQDSHNEEKLKSMEPANKWGSLYGAFGVIAELLVGCVRFYENGVFHVG